MNPEDSMTNPQQPTFGPQPGQDVQQANVPIPPANAMFQPIVPPSPQSVGSFDPSVVQPGTQGANPVDFSSSDQPFQSPQPMTKLPTPPKKPSIKKPLIVASITILVLVAVTAGAIMFAGGKKQTPVATDQTQQAQGPQPAQAIDVEQTNNSINQDVTGFDNTKDFPDNMLEDTQLGL